MNMLRTLAATAALTLGALAPAAAATNLPDLPAHITFSTAITPAYFGGGEYAGTLNLTIAKDGSLSGIYRPEDTGMFRTVTGGLDGDRVWLDLGYDGPHITGTLRDGKIVGTTPYFLHSDGFDGPGSQPYNFTATPEAKRL
jgi:hypothetical protein